MQIAPTFYFVVPPTHPLLSFIIQHGSCRSKCDTTQPLSASVCLLTSVFIQRTQASIFCYFSPFPNYKQNPHHQHLNGVLYRNQQRYLFRCGAVSSPIPWSCPLLHLLIMWKFPSPKSPSSKYLPFLYLLRLEIYNKSPSMIKSCPIGIHRGRWSDHIKHWCGVGQISAYRFVFVTCQFRRRFFFFLLFFASRTYDHSFYFDLIVAFFLVFVVVFFFFCYIFSLRLCAAAYGACMRRGWTPSICGPPSHTQPQPPYSK